MQKYSLQIETLIEKRRIAQESAITIMKESSISVSSIAIELECSRTTLYNHNQLLKRYIESIAQDFDKENPIRFMKSLG